MKEKVFRFCSFSLRGGGGMMKFEGPRKSFFFFFFFNKEAKMLEIHEFWGGVVGGLVFCFLSFYGSTHSTWKFPG